MCYREDVTGLSVGAKVNLAPVLFFFKIGVSMIKYGFFIHLPFSEYAAIPAINNGAVSAMIASPAQGKAFLEGKSKQVETPQMRLGSLLHLFVLEPEVASRSVVVAQPCCAVLKSGANKGLCCGNAASHTNGVGWFCGTHKASEPDVVQATNYITEQELETINGMVSSIRSSTAGEFLSMEADTECTMVFEGLHGFDMKGRADWLSKDRNILLDIKKVQGGAANLASCQQKIASYGYHRQMAIYRMGVELTTGCRPKTCGWIFVEESYPYDTNVVIALDQDLEIGLAEVDEALSRYRSAVDSDVFPGYNRKGEVSLGGLPEYYKRRFVQERASNDGRISGSGSSGSSIADDGTDESGSAEPANEWEAWLSNHVDQGSGAAL